MNKKLRLIDVIVFMLFFSIAKIYAIPQVAQQLIKIVFIAIILIFLISKNAIRFKNFGFWIALVYLIPTVIGGAAGTLSVKQLLDGILNSSCIFSIYSVIEFYASRGKLKYVINDLYVCNLTACVVSLISIMILGRPTGFSGTEFNYFFGNKFSTSYLFILLVGLYYVKNYSANRETTKKTSVLLGIIFLELFVSYWTRCSTTLLGGTVLLLALVFSGKWAKKAQNLFSVPIITVLCFIVPGFVAVNLQYFVNLPWINNLFTNILNKSAGLTGRAYIYSNIVKIFMEKPIFGYGYNSEIVQNVTRVGNAQNGLFQILIDYGLFGAVILSISIFIAFKVSRGNSRFWGVKVVYLALCICSIVEISINYYFYLSFFLLMFSDTYDFVGAGISKGTCPDHLKKRKKRYEPSKVFN